MSNVLKFSAVAIGFIFLASCSSMHPPTTEPYFPGFHSRSADKVEQEYDQWKVQKEVREERAARQDSLMEKYYSEGYPYSGYSFDRYDYYYSPRHRYFNPYPNRYSFGFGYSTYPHYVDPWWAYDNYWDAYYWNSWHSYPYNSYYSSRNYYYRSYYNSPYYWHDYNYGHYPYYGGGGSAGGSDDPGVMRPRNRDSYGRFVNGSPMNMPGSTMGKTTLNNTNSAASADDRKTTPAVVDRSRFRHLDSGDYQVDRVKQRPVNRGYSSSRNNDSDDNARSSRSSSNRNKTYGSSSSSSSRSYGTSSRSSSSGSRSSASSSRSSGSSSSASSSRSSGSSSSESSGSSSRSRNRNR